jgi:hypothetical protein
MRRTAAVRARREGLRREGDAILLAQRRIATLVAGGAPPAEVFAANRAELAAHLAQTPAGQRRR